MTHFNVLAGAVACCLLLPGLSRADKEVKTGPLALKLVARESTYTWDASKKSLEQHRREMIRLTRPRWSFIPNLPAGSEVDLILQIVNNGQEDVNLYVEGDINILTLDLKGPGVIAAVDDNVFDAVGPPRLPRIIQLAPGKSHDIPLRQLQDGVFGHRKLYWTGPGEYTLAAAYQLGDGQGGIGPVLRSEPIKLTLEEVAWGEIVGGLQAGLAIKPGQQRAYQVGEQVPLVVKLRNLGPKEIKLVAFDGGSISPTAEKADGTPALTPGLSAFSIFNRRTIKPGEVIELLDASPLLASDAPSFGVGWPTVVVAPGRYKLRYPTLAVAIDGSATLAKKLGTGKIDIDVKPLEAAKK